MNKQNEGEKSSEGKVLDAVRQKLQNQLGQMNLIKRTESVSPIDPKIMNPRFKRSNNEINTESNYEERPETYMEEETTNDYKVTQSIQKNKNLLKIE